MSQWDCPKYFLMLGSIPKLPTFFKFDIPATCPMETFKSKQSILCCGLKMFQSSMCPGFFIL